tara:strand:+ start:401 stop:781 length:381 start_codon:yes stop_codon:yes gene_type:complete
MFKDLWFGLLWLGLLGCATSARPPVLLAAAGPIYPEHARLQQIEGFVTLAYDLTVSGNVVNVRVLDSVPAGVFDTSAVNAVRDWRFLPMQHNGQSIPVTNQRSTLTFKLAEDQKDSAKKDRNHRAR